jgi:hypothetical protein
VKERRQGGDGGLYIFVQIEIQISWWEMPQVYDADASIKLVSA